MLARTDAFRKIQSIVVSWQNKPIFSEGFQWHAGQASSHRRGARPMTTAESESMKCGLRRRNRDRRRRLLLVLDLQPVERGVAPVLAQQFVVAAGFDDRAALDHQDAVGMRDGVQPVRDGDGGAALAEMRHGVLNQPLGFGIERRGRLVEQDDLRVLDQRAGDGDALALAAGKLRAALADRRVVARREARDEFMGMRGLGRGDDFILGCAGFADGDVVADRAVEQEHVLADIRHLPAQRAARHVGDGSGRRF